MPSTTCYPDCLEHGLLTGELCNGHREVPTKTLKIVAAKAEAAGDPAGLVAYTSASGAR